MSSYEYNTPQNCYGYTHWQGYCNNGCFSQGSRPYKNQIVSAQVQKLTSSQKEKQAMVNHLLGKLLSHMELILSKQGVKLTTVYHKYLSNAAVQSSTVDLLRNCKQFVAALWINSDESNLLVNALNTKDTLDTIGFLLKYAESIHANNHEAAIAKKVLLKVIGELKQGYVEPFTHVLSNEIYNHDVRNKNAEIFITERQNEAIHAVTKVQEDVKAITSQIGKIPDEKIEFSPEPQIHVEDQVGKGEQVVARHPPRSRSTPSS